MIKAVLFDAGGTLLKPHPSVGRVYAEIAAKHGAKADAAALDEKFRAVWKKQKTLRRAMNKEWWREVVMGVFSEHSFTDSDAFFDDLYYAFAESARWKIFPDVLPTLSALREQNISLAVASNWDDRLPKLLRELQLAPYFDHQFISALIGHVKPDRAFFDHTLKLLGLEPHEVLHVGDDPHEDVVGATSVGIKAVLLDRSAKSSAGDTVNSLAALLEIIRSGR